MAYTKPSSEDYEVYLREVHGLKCESAQMSNCFHTINDLKSSSLTHQLIFMTARSNIFGEADNKIRVIGILNHFFVIQNNLHPKSDENKSKVHANGELYFNENSDSLGLYFLVHGNRCFNFKAQSKTNFMESDGTATRKSAWNIEIQSNTLFSADISNYQHPLNN